MKRLVISIVVMATIVGSVFAQGEIDAYKLSRNDLKGSARSVAMGGAFGALGGDVSGVAINPAGIGVYTSSEIVTTMNFSNTNTKTELNAGKIDDRKFKFSFDNLAYVGAFPTGDYNVPFVNFGFSYNRLKNFDRQISMQGNNLNSSITDYMAYRAGQTNTNDLGLVSNPYAFQDADWLGVLGYNTFVTGLQGYDSETGYNYTKRGNYSGNYGSILGNGEQVNNRMFLHEKGYINSYDFNVGTTISNILSLGVTISVTDLNYNLYSEYDETFLGPEGGSMYLTNQLRTEGAGYQFKGGIILKPIQQLRLGVSYHSPTWYNLTDTYTAQLDAIGNKVDSWDYENGVSSFDYNFKTPDKWTFSLAGVIGKRAIISADYELTNYGNMTLNTTNGTPLSNGIPNATISEHFKTSGALRVGGEFRFTPQITGRVGYSWVESPIESKVKDGVTEIVTAGATPQYTIDGNTNYFTYGAGYKFNNSNNNPNNYFYIDIAFIMKNQKDDLYPFSSVVNNDGSVAINSVPAKLTTNSFGGLLTLGYKF